MADITAAKNVVSAIGQKRGYVSEATRLRMRKVDPDAAEEFEQALDGLRRETAQTIDTLATKVYGSDARFVFELLQNADDNSYTKAEARGEQPSITFSIFDDHIVIECNEDGFTKANVEAICSVGQSTKTTSCGYIGAKGIGFKAAFMAAKTVEIQSRAYSFHFKHDKDDDGLGMITPIWHDHDASVSENVTRTVLHLHDKGCASDIRHLKQTILAQFTDIHHSCLLFLRRIKSITIAIHHPVEPRAKTTTFTATRGIGHTVLLTTEIEQEGRVIVKRTEPFHLTRYLSPNVASSDNRDYAEAAADTTSEIVLAFPLDQDSAFKLTLQHVYAFLPVRWCGFHFLIQADFDTTANRQDIVSTSRRNVDLRRGVASAFIAAIQQFNQLPALRHHWPKLLPQERSIPDRFWVELVPAIRKEIAATECLFGLHTAHARRPSALTIVPPGFRNGLEGGPLLDDRFLDPFVSSRYPDSTYDALRQVGVQSMTPQLTLDLVSRDLMRSEASIIRSTGASNQWHNLLCKHLLAIKDAAVLSALKQLDLIPIDNCRRWTHVAPYQSVYFPTVDKVAIPSDLGYQMVDLPATESPDRRSLYKFLGVKDLTKKEVDSSIFNKMQSGFRTVSDAVSNLRFMYLTHSYTFSRHYYLKVGVANRKPAICKPHLTAVYLEDDHPYGPWQMSEAIKSSGVQISFLNSQYLLEDVSTPAEAHNIAWKDWLISFAKLRTRLSLLADDNIHSLSNIWITIVKHAPGNALGLLGLLWPLESAQLSAVQVAALKATDVKEMCTMRLLSGCTLAQSWVPFADLQRCHSDFMRPTEPFPFLNLGTGVSDEILVSKYSFLTHTLDVGHRRGAAFFLALLEWIRKAHSEGTTVEEWSRILRLYAQIQLQCLSSAQGASGEVVDLIRKRSALAQLVYVPSSVENQAVWASPGQCLWRAPKNMVSKRPLEALYTKACDKDQTDILSSYFGKTLAVRDASWQDLVVELQQLSTGTLRKTKKIELVEDIYRHLATLSLGSDEIKSIRAAFHEKRLILASQLGDWWCTPSDCIWSSSTAITGRKTLNEHYMDDLQNFFVDTLGVPTLTIGMVYSELCRCKATTPVDSVKNLLWNLNSFLDTELNDDQDSSRLDVRKLMQATILPVVDVSGKTTLCNIETEFYIADRTLLTQRFGRLVRMLDFSFDKVHKLRHFLRWTGLTSRGLSKCVKLDTRVSSAEAVEVYNPSRRVQNKAGAYLRLASHYGSPRYESDAKALYTVLRNTKLLETGHITAVEFLIHDKKTIEVAVESDNIHLDEQASALRVYVPADESQQDVCFGSDVPKRLAEWLMTDKKTNYCPNLDPLMIGNIQSLLSCMPSSADKVLEKQGIIQVSIAEFVDVQDLPTDPPSNTDNAASYNRPTPSDAGVSQQRPAAALGVHEARSAASPEPHESYSEEEADSQAPQSVGVLTPVSTASSPRSQPTDIVRRIQPFSRRLQQDRLPTPLPVASSQAVANTQYEALLRHVVSTARRSRIPRCGAYDMSSLMAALPDLGQGIAEDEADDQQQYHFRTVDRLERDMRIGAAGELYIFELLSKEQLPGWSRDVWQSTIRKYARAHSDYHDMSEWRGRETADLVYEDTQGFLTALLVDQGFLDSTWRMARPKYYLEVKTSTNVNSTPFYVSKYQYSRMYNQHCQERRDEVYLIFRVFNLRSSQIGVSVYIDPIGLEEDGRLVFTSEGWSVVPGRPSSAHSV